MLVTDLFEKVKYEEKKAKKQIRGRSMKNSHYW